MNLNAGTAPARGAEAPRASAVELMAKISESKKIIDEMLRCSETNTIAYSGGKDSRVLAHLLKEHGAPLDAVSDVSLTFEADQKSNDQFADELGLVVTKVNRFGPDWIKRHRHFIFADLKTLASFYNVRQQTTIENHVKSKGYSGVFIGRRTQENTVRQAVYFRAIKKWYCNPLRSWRYEHIWAYVFMKGLPLSPVYDHPAGRINGSGSWVSVSNAQVGHWGYNSFDLVQDYDSRVMDRLAEWWPPAIEYRRRGYYPGILEVTS